VTKLKVTTLVVANTGSGILQPHSFLTAGDVVLDPLKIYKQSSVTNYMISLQRGAEEVTTGDSFINNPRCFFVPKFGILFYNWLVYHIQVRYQSKELQSNGTKGYSK